MKYNTNQMNICKVYPVTSERTGQPVKNQYLIKCGEVFIFQSYESIVVEYDREAKRMTIDNSVALCSRTTAKYFNQFLINFGCMDFGKTTREEIKERIKAVPNGYTVVDMNEGVKVYTE